MSSFSISLLHFNLNRIKLFFHGLGVHENHIETIVLHWNNHCPSCCLIGQVQAFLLLISFSLFSVDQQANSFLFSFLVSFLSSVLQSIIVSDTNVSCSIARMMTRITSIVRLLFLLCCLISSSRISALIYLNNCSFAINFYQQYLNLLYSSNDFHTIHLQAVYSYPVNHSLTPGHIYTYQRQSVALIPLLIRCTYPTTFLNVDYLPFTQCSSTITNFLSKRNYEPTRTYLNLRSILSFKDVPLLYTGEYNLLLTNCSFRLNSTVYQLKSTDLFTFHIQYEPAIADSSCQSCNQRTSICHEHQCICRPGASPIELFDEKRFCIDTTTNCSFDPHRCLMSKSFVDSSTTLSRRSTSILIILIISLSCGSINCLLLGLLLWCVAKEKFDTLVSQTSRFTIESIDLHYSST